MRRLPVVFAVVIALAGADVSASAAPAPADPVHSPSRSARRQFVSQVIDCMRKRMADDKHISYNHAAKICKAEATQALDGASAGPLVAADTKH